MSPGKSAVCWIFQSRAVVSVWCMCVGSCAVGGFDTQPSSAQCTRQQASAQGTDRSSSCSRSCMNARKKKPSSKPHPLREAEMKFYVARDAALPSFTSITLGCHTGATQLLNSRYPFGIRMQPSPAPQHQASLCMMCISDSPS